MKRSKLNSDRLARRMIPPGDVPAFTLLELLISISIIAALAIIGSVVGKSVLIRSKDAKSVGNLRQIGGVIAAYSAENDGLVPGRMTTKTTPGGTIYNKYWHWELYDAGVVSNVDVFLNPKEKYNSIAQWSKDTGKQFISLTAPIYGYRDWLPVYDAKKQASIPNPSQFFLVAESWCNDLNQPGYFIGLGATGKVWMVKVDARGVANALFADGHVEAKSRQYFEELHITQPEQTIEPITVWPKK